mgnify:CR=1 FL=1
MTTITLEDLQARHTELGKLIDSFKAVLPTTLHIPSIDIELRQGERYVGLILSEQGQPSHHLVLLPGKAENKTWEQALAWAAEQGGELPTRAEQSLLFANLKGEFEEAYYWSGQAHETNSSWAWYQYFLSGGQGYGRKSNEFRARAVRRLVIE